MVRTLQTRKVGTAKDPWRGYAEITSSYDSHNSRSEVGKLWVAWCHPSGFQMWLRSMFYLRTSMIHLPAHLSPKSPLWRWDGCGLAGTTVFTKEDNPIACAKERIRQRCYASQWRWLHMTIPTSMRVGLPITTANQGDGLMSQMGHLERAVNQRWQTDLVGSSVWRRRRWSPSSECQISKRMLN